LSFEKSGHPGSHPHAEEGWEVLMEERILDS